MSVTISGIPIVDMPDLGAVTDSTSVVAEHAGSGRVSAPAMRDYIKQTTDDTYLALTGGTVTGPTCVGPPVMADFGVPMLGVHATSGSQNSVIGQVTNSLPPATLAFPCGVTGYGTLTTAGNTVFGVFGRADLSTFGVPGVATNELNSFNYAGMPTGVVPFNNAFGTTEFCAVALQIVAYGTYPSLVGVAVLAGEQPFQYGVYIHPQAATAYGLYIDASLTVSPAGAAAVIRAASPVAGPNLILQQMGTFNGARTALQVADSAGTPHAWITHAGDFGTPGITVGHDGTIDYLTATLAATATAGISGAAPAQVVGYLVQKIAGASYKIPYYNM